jgi:hypothetical protein
MDKGLFYSIEKYIKDYKSSKITTNNAQEVISKFNKDWNMLIGCSGEINSNGYSKYGSALMILSLAYLKYPTLKKKDTKWLSDLILEYENFPFQFEIKFIIFYYLGECWLRLDCEKDAIYAFKKFIYYYMKNNNPSSKRPITAYAFRKCNIHLYQALINEQLNISSPTTFNDPFDCSFIELMDKEYQIPSLVRQVYIDCLKIACFIKQLQTTNIVNNRKKEPINNLMWAHYTDSHKGICIKYNLDNITSQLDYDKKNVIAYFKKIKYSDEDITQKRLSDLLIESAFIKGKEWEYEKELRFFYYDVNGHGEHDTIDIPNCIEAIYFGLKCSEKDKKTIINIMKDKKLVIRDIHGYDIGERPILFYQMEIDKEHFGQLKAKRITMSEILAITKKH